MSGRPNQRNRAQRRLAWKADRKNARRAGLSKPSWRESAWRGYRAVARDEVGVVGE